MKKLNLDLNVISGGHCGPFAYRDTDGIHIGDCDNHERYYTVAGALEYAHKARLSGDVLERARAALETNPHGNEAAEYRWHEDAGLQIDALQSLA